MSTAALKANLDLLEAHVTKTEAQSPTVWTKIDLLPAENSVPEPISVSARIMARNAAKAYFELVEKIRPVIQEYRDAVAEIERFTPNAPHYGQVGFRRANRLLSPDSLGPTNRDWVSASTEIYRQIAEAFPAKFENLRAAIKRIASTLRQLSTNLDIAVQGFNLAVLGAVVAVVGLGLALAGIASSSGPGLILAIISFVAAVAGLGAAYLSLRFAGDANVVIKLAASDIVEVGDSVTRVNWPENGAILSAPATWDSP